MAAPRLIDGQYDGPQRIDRYELVAEVASGGMATVYLARLSGVGGFRRFVAIKRLHPHLATEQEFVEMFLDEARLAAGIHHPNVVPILEVGASERGYYLVMEYIEGDTLARLLARAATAGVQFPMSIGIRVLVDMLAGLHAAHELRDEHGQPTELVHRDVSPQNVLVGMDGNTRITDFGVARAASRLSATRAGQLKGKIAYMAPEQATGDPHVDRRADVFSSGIVLWEVLAARRLFKAENEAATLSRVISEQVPDICEVNPDVHPDVGRVVMRALSRDRSERYATCAEFADELEKAAAGAGELAAAKEVAAYVAEVIGNEISQQREAVRAWLARSEPSQVAPEVLDLPPRVSALPPPMPGPGPVQTDQSHSGFVASPPAVASEPPPPRVMSRSRTPLIVAIAGLCGFIGVGLFVTLFESSERVVLDDGVAAAKPPPVAQPAPTVHIEPLAKPSATSVEPGAEAAVAPESLPQERSKSNGPSGSREKTQPSVSARTSAVGQSESSGAAAPIRVRPTPPALQPAPSGSAGGRSAAPSSGVDLSNPYR